MPLRRAARDTRLVMQGAFVNQRFAGAPFFVAHPRRKNVDSKQLYCKAGETQDEAEAIRNAAMKENNGEGRDLTDEEVTQIDELVKKAKRFKARGDCLKELEDLRGAERRTAPNPLTTSTRPTEAPRTMVIPASAKRYIPKYIKGPDADLRAYRLGMFFAAAMGHEGARALCRDHGIELRVHQEKVNSQGGILVPDELDQDIIILREQFGLARQFTRNSPMTSDVKIRPRQSGGLTAHAVGEGAAITESTMAWNDVKLVAKDWGVLSRMSAQVNEDAFINLGDTLSREIAYAFAQKEDDCLFNGDGTSTYHGIVGIRQAFLNLSATRANIAGVVVGAGNAWSELTMANFTSLVGLLPQYADTPSARWFVHKVFFWTVMADMMVDAGGNTIGDIQSGAGMQFLGYPVQFAQVMPKTEANDTICAILGDASLASDFGDRRQTTIAFSTDATIGGESMFERNQIGIRGTERFDISVHDVGNAAAAAADKQPGPLVGLLTAAA